MTRENTTINEDDFIIIEEFDGRGNKIRRAVSKQSQKPKLAPRKIHGEITRGAHQTKIVACKYPGQAEWEEYAEIIGRRLCIKVRAGYAKPLGKYLEFELVKGITNRVYCDFLTEDGIFPIRHMVETFRTSYVNKLYEMARLKFFNMIYNNNLAIREIDDKITRAFKERLEKIKKSNGMRTAEEVQEEFREFELNKIQKKNSYNRKKERIERFRQRQQERDRKE